MANEFILFCFAFVCCVYMGINLICRRLEELDATMQMVHMELYKIRMGEDWADFDSKD